MLSCLTCAYIIIPQLSYFKLCNKQYLSATQSSYSIVLGFIMSGNPNTVMLIKLANSEAAEQYKPYNGPNSLSLHDVSWNACILLQLTLQPERLMGAEEMSCQRDDQDWNKYLWCCLSLQNSLSPKSNPQPFHLSGKTWLNRHTHTKDLNQNHKIWKRLRNIIPNRRSSAKFNWPECGH